MIEFSPAWREYEQLLEQLHDLARRGLFDSQEADVIRDRMDGPWYWMSEEEHIQISLGELGRQLEKARAVCDPECPFKDDFGFPSASRIVARCGILRLPGHPEGEIALIEDVKGFSVQSAAAAGEVLTHRGRWACPDDLVDGEGVRWPTEAEARAALEAAEGVER